MKMKATRTHYPRSKSFPVAAFLTALAAVVISADLHAQIGTGWTRYSPTSVIDVESGNEHTEHGAGASGTSFSYKGVKFSNLNGVETFQIVNTQSNRIERRSDEHYASGKRQWEAEVRLTSPTNQFIYQIFAGGGVGMYWSLRARNSIAGGGVRVGSTTVASGVYGTWVRFNVLHDIDGRTMKCYVNGSLKTSGSAAGPADYSYNMKYGLYGTLTESTGSKAEYRNVKSFK
jgi:hypothetical protein